MIDKDNSYWTWFLVFNSNVGQGIILQDELSIFILDLFLFFYYYLWFQQSDPGWLHQLTIWQTAGQHLDYNYTGYATAWAITV